MEHSSAGMSVRLTRERSGVRASLLPYPGHERSWERATFALWRPWVRIPYAPSLQKSRTADPSGFSSSYSLFTHFLHSSSVKVNSSSTVVSKIRAMSMASFNDGLYLPFPDFQWSLFLHHKTRQIALTHIVPLLLSSFLLLNRIKNTALTPIRMG